MRITKQLMGAAVAVVFGFASIASADTSATVNIGGSVASSATVAAVATANATTLDLTTQSEQIVHVADLTVDTNNSTGLTMSISSGSLTRTAAGEQGVTPIPFKVAVADDQAAPLQSSDFTNESGVAYTKDSQSSGEKTYDLYVAYTPALVQDPGAYDATITITVADN